MIQDKLEKNSSTITKLPDSNRTAYIKHQALKKGVCATSRRTGGLSYSLNMSAVMLSTSGSYIRLACAKKRSKLW
jgi:hypothetical protein